MATPISKINLNGVLLDVTDVEVRSRVTLLENDTSIKSLEVRVEQNEDNIVTLQSDTRVTDIILGTRVVGNSTKLNGHEDTYFGKVSQLLHGGVNSSGATDGWDWVKYEDGYCTAETQKNIACATGVLWVTGWYHHLSDFVIYPFTITTPRFIVQNASGFLSTYAGTDSVDNNKFKFYLTNGVSGSMAGSLVHIIMNGKWK